MTLKIVSSYNGVSDPDAAAYISAVEAADGELLEFAVGKAINDFVLGCKQDGVWDAIKASCILAGARTLNGALVPLKGAAPTNFNFVSGDYNRKTGLAGDGNTKYLNTNRAENADPLNNCHYSLYASTLGAAERGFMAPADDSPTLIYRQTANMLFRSRVATPLLTMQIAGNAAGFIGHARSSSSAFVGVFAGSTSSISSNSLASGSSNMLLYNRAMGNYTDARFAFYSIGEALDLALLDGRVTDLITALAAAIP